MQLLRAAGLGLLLSLTASLASASPAVPQNGVDYATLAQPQSVQANGKKVEVIEFFMYHCPVCNALEPLFEDWIRKQGDRITVRRIHIPSTGPADPEAHLYLTLEALGRLGDMHEKVFKAVHVDHIRLNKDDAIIDWVAKNGIDRAQFLDAWHSFGVTTRLRQLRQVTASYQVESAPTLVVGGRFLTNPGLLSNQMQGLDREAVFKATLNVADKLVDKAAQPK
ncbi:thiol:disulfide interchange protein DsbA/DsbL [Massilia putida]|uniref:thiol:disulfide interchange protein DsbA/DsbL n=1 Tax=Massilia putida TaxID=1141883 RepID=UPI000951EC79|nr:thiol:disulfide interchange protein DsbA/DsbL [Massilia putida]